MKLQKNTEEIIIEETRREYDVTVEQFTDMLAIQWKYATRVKERVKNGLMVLSFLAHISGKEIVTGSITLKERYWATIKEAVITKADNLK